MSAERLQKILARAGLGSRRASEAVIAAGRVQVNGETVTELGTRADPGVDRITVDGRPLALPRRFVYLAAHKPAGLVTTASDERGRPTVFRLLPPDLAERVFPIGRLDRDTEGLLLFTNDGELAFRLTHPRYGVEKEYLVLPETAPAEEALARLRSGVEVEGRHTAPARVERAAGPGGDPGWIRLVIHQGRKRQVRLMFAAAGYRVRRLLRTRVGPVLLEGLPAGAVRPLRAAEVRRLAASVKLVRPPNPAL